MVIALGSAARRSPGKRRPRAPRARHAQPANDVYKALDCMVLSVDPGTHCGAALTLRGMYFDSGSGDGYDPRFISKWICAGRDFANLAGVPLVLVLEKPPRGGAPYEGRNMLGAASVIGCRKLWLSMWKQTEGVVNRLHADVYPVSWRSRVLGVTTGEQLESREIGVAAQAALRVFKSRDQAAAVCIGQWAARAGALASLLPKPSQSRPPSQGDKVDAGSAG